jgi:hypothetical protein
MNVIFKHNVACSKLPFLLPIRRFKQLALFYKLSFTPTFKLDVVTITEWYFEGNTKRLEKGFLTVPPNRRQNNNTSSLGA